jgi:hemolysin activation/secretion protein
LTSTEKFSHYEKITYWCSDETRFGLHTAKKLQIPSNIIVLFQPPYSPELNPIERLWQALKKDLKWELFSTSIEARTRINRNEIISDSLEEFDIRGELEEYELSFRQPLIRSPRNELALGLSFNYQDGQTFTFQGATPFGIGPDEDGVSRTSVLKFEQEYINRQVSGAWALNSQLNFGTGLFDATDNSDSIPDGQFFSWLAQIQRVQVLSEDNFLIIQGDLQLTPDSLLPAQQFVIGGGQSVRGFRQNVRSGDNGFRFLIEERFTIARDESGEGIFTLAPFFNMGSVWNVDDNPNNLPDQNFIAAVGLGLLWEPLEGLNLRLDYAPPLVDLDDKGDNIQDNGFYFSLSYSN